MIRNPVRIRTAGPADAQALAAYVQKSNAPATIDGADVIIPGDQPGFLFSVLDHAEECGYATDEDCSEAIMQMEAGLP